MRMSSDEYAAFVNSLSPRSPIWGDLLRAGLVGGVICTVNFASIAGSAVGSCVGSTVGCSPGACVGSIVGCCVGAMREDAAMDELVESIRVHGILSPLLARPKGEGYELVSGHRRRLAAQRLGLPTVPVLVREMTDDEAVILMVDSNLQRENLLPSEKAFAYKMKLEAMKHQGMTCGQVGHKSRDAVSNDDSGRTIQRYIRLTNLVPPLLQMVDDGHIAFSPAVELSYLTRDEQAELWDLIGQEDATPSLSQALRMKQLSREAKLTPEVLYAILTEEKPNQKEQVRIKTESLRKYFPRNYSVQQMEREIIKLLEARYRAKNRGER